MEQLASSDTADSGKTVKDVLHYSLCSRKLTTAPSKLGTALTSWVMGNVMVGEDGQLKT